MAEFITTERHGNGVELIRFNRPPMNALSVELLGELAGHVEALATDADLKAVVVTGNEKAFAAGAEISQIQTDTDRLLDSFRRAFDGFEALPRPVIAAVSGIALGGGLRSGAGLRPAPGGGERPPRCARDAPRRLPRGRRHPAAIPTRSAHPGPRR